MRNYSLLSPSRIRVIIAALALVACDTGTVGFSGTSTSPGIPGVDSTADLILTVTPSPVKISVGAAAQFTASLRNKGTGQVLYGTPAWNSSNTGVATIDSTGLATGVGVGTTTITARQHGVSTSADLEVDQIPVASVATSPRTDTLQVGTQVTLSAVTKDNVGNTLTGRLITWTTRSPSIATVSGSGTVTAVAVGVDSVLATSEGVTGASIITVVNVPVASVVMSLALDTIQQGGTVQLTATPEDASNNPLNRPVTWSSGNTGVATVNSGGLVTGTGVGSTTITASSGGQSGVMTIVVIQVPVASVTVTPPTPSVQIGKTVQLTATTRDAKGNTLTGRVVTWGSNSGNATVSGTGLVTGVTAGGATITATSEGKNGTAAATVTVAPPVMVRIITSPDTATINTGGTKQFSTVGKYSDSSTAAVTPTYAATGGTVSANGLYTAGSTGGTFKVTATSSTFADTSTVTVVKPPVALVLVTPALDTVAPTKTYQLTATTKDAGGNILTGRVVTWGSSNTAVATVNGSGLVTAVGTGTATITATSETIPGTATAVVNVVLAATVSIAPAGPSVVQGASVGLSATVRDRNGAILTGHPVTWSSLSGTIATVNPATGSVTGVSPGTATIKATVDTASGSTTVTVDTLTTTAPWLLEDFSSYTSTSNLIADPRGIYSVAEDETPTQIFLDNTVGYGSSTQSMRFDFPDRTSEGGSGTSGRCTDFTIGRNITLPSPQTEIWIEVYAKFSNGFTSVAPAAWGCTSAPAYKFVFGRTPTGRFNLVLGIFGGDYTFGWPANQEPSDDAMPFTPFDGQWHQYHMHFKVSTPAGSSSANGACELWVDGVLVKSFTGIVETNSYIYGLAIGRNMNQGPGAPESEWWGKIAVWNTNPGW
ncbi:MAG TPA: Ig-like domain-containing protein [Gemmatimonadales bacterium]|nr:Ig-like domain-containing protein [Gemmatimonadales bacterium]